MKTILITIAALITINASGQTNKTNSTNRAKANTKNKASNNFRVKTDTATLRKVEPRQTITEKYLNGDRKDAGTQIADNKSSPFVGGITAATNASTTFDTSNRTAATTTNTTTTNNTPGISVRNDTAFNINSANPNGLTTTSGAVDKSGQAQFGQTNWRQNTIGESQWTVPPPITSSFNKDYPIGNNVTWSRNTKDTSMYMARYRTDAGWMMSTYNNSGQRMDTRTEILLTQTPKPVTLFSAKQATAFQVTNVYRLQAQGRPDIYEIQTKDGRTFYLNNDGVEVKYSFP